MSALSFEEMQSIAQGRYVAQRAAMLDAIVEPPSPVPAPAEDTLRFLRQVLPSTGTLVLAIAESGRRWRHVPHSTVESLATDAISRSAQGENVYYGIASFRDAGGKLSRKAENVERLRCLFLDIDCGKGGHSYADEPAMEKAIADFTAALGVEPTAIVHSGAGRHLFWVFDEDLTRGHWHELAEALKKYSQRYGLLADPTVTADAARLLRAPGTRTKHGNVARLLSEGPTVSVERMREALERLRTAPVATTGAVVSLQVSARLDQWAVPASLQGIDDRALSQGLNARSDWLQALSIERQLQLLGEMMAACPDSYWSNEPWWAHVVRAVATLDQLPLDSRLDLLAHHSARSPKWADDGWSRERLHREKWRTTDGTASLGSLIQTAEQHGWQRPVDVSIPVRFADRETLIAYLVAQYAYVAEQGAYLNRKTRALISRESLVEAESWRVPIDGEKAINLSSLLRTERRIERVDTIGYAPGEADVYARGPRRIANQFRAWAPEPLTPIDAESDLICEFLGHLTPDDEGEVFRRWIWHAMAWLLQRPGARLPVAALLAGSQGCGKSTLFEEVPRLLFGPHNVASVTAGELDSQFNDWLGSARILTMPELRMGSARDSRRVADALKPIITSQTARIHPKGAKGYEQENVVSIFATSNHGDAVHLEDDDRRWVVYESPAERIPDELAGRLYAFLKGPRASGVLRTIFTAVDVSKFNPHALPPLSRAKQLMVDASRSPMEAALVGRFERREFPFDLPAFLIEDCRAAAMEDGVDWRGNTPQAIAKVLRNRPIAARSLGRFRVDSRGVGLGSALVRDKARRDVWVASRNNPLRWMQAGEEFIRRVLKGEAKDEVQHDDADAWTQRGRHES